MDSYLFSAIRCLLIHPGDWALQHRRNLLSPGVGKDNYTVPQFACFRELIFRHGKCRHSECNHGKYRHGTCNHGKFRNGNRKNNKYRFGTQNAGALNKCSHGNCRHGACCQGKFRKVNIRLINVGSGLKMQAH